MGSEGSFLATAAVSDSPPASSPHQSPRMSDVEVETHDVRRVSSQDAPSSSAYGYAYQAPLRTSSSFPGPGPTTGMSSPRPGAEGGPGYPSRVERPHSRLASSAFGTFPVSPLPMPSPPAGRSHFAGPSPDTQSSSQRLPGIGALGLGHSLQPPREPSPRPSREHAEGEGEPAPKRQRTRMDPSSDEGENSG
jgi:hypothetical protein